LRRVAQALADSGLPPRLLELEITESIAMAEPKTMVLRLTELKRIGVDLARRRSGPDLPYDRGAPLTAGHAPPGMLRGYGTPRRHQATLRRDRA
jgi:hypothetical protein